MEKVKGTALANVWFGLPVAAKYKIIEQIVDIEARLSSAAFPAHGSLYHTAELPREWDSTDANVLAGDALKEFCIGPVVDPVLWRDERYEMNLSRGPCEFTTSLCSNHAANP